MPLSIPRDRVFLWLVAIGAAIVAALALHQAVRWYDRPIGGMFVTPDLEVSAVGLPTWDGLAKGLAYPDRVLAVDGVDLSNTPGPAGSERWDRAIEDAARRGAPTVHVRMRTARGERDLDLAICRVGPAAWWLYAGGLLFIGALYFIAGLTAIGASPKGQLARAFSKFSLIAGIYLFVFFDAQTGRVFLPLFYLAFAWAPLALLGLALRLPDDVTLVRRVPAIFGVLDALGILVGFVMIVRSALGGSLTALREVWTVVFGCSVLLFVIIFVVRFVHAQGPRRDVLRVLFRPIVLPYALIAAGVLASTLSSRGSVAVFFALPALALTPIATGVAFVRHDLWGSRALLSRVFTRGVSGALACVVAVGLGAAFAASLGVLFRDALVAAAAGAVASIPLVHAALRVVDRSFFPAIAEYKPTIEHLSEDLTSIAAPEEVSSAVERTVRRWLDCEHVRFVPVDTADAEGKVSARTNGDGHDLVLPARFRGRTLGFLMVGGKRGDALFTTEDIDLLRTIANQAALALAHAQSYAELEQRRREQATAWQIERLALVETLAAEVAHEVRYPINFFRSVFSRGPGAATLDADEVDVGGEEVDRLERLVSGLKRLVGYRIERRTIEVADLSARTELLLRDALGSRAIDLDVPEHAALRCDPDQIRQLLVNLVSNALESSGPEGRVGIAWTETSAGATLAVWDDGPGFEGDVSRLFAPWFTTKPRGTGLGLAITQRIVRAHGWTIDAERAGGLTRFVVTVPRADVITRAASAAAAGGARS
jgi:signal transduction histidine kinase